MFGYVAPTDSVLIKLAIVSYYARRYILSAEQRKQTMGAPVGNNSCRQNSGYLFLPAAALMLIG